MLLPIHIAAADCGVCGGVDAANPLIYFAVAVMMLAVAEFASWLPARRATRIDPVIALRNE